MKLFLNNKDPIDFNEQYDQWIFDLDNTIYDFNLGLFSKVSSRMSEYIIDFFYINDVDALTLNRNMYKKYVEKFMIWQLHNRTEIICFVGGFVVGAIIL